MARRPDGAEPRTKLVGARLTPAGLAEIKRVLRRGESLSAFVRTALRSEVEHRSRRA